MLNDEIIDKVNERLVRRIEQGNEYILQIIGNNLKKIKNLKKSDVNKLSNILKYGGDYEKIVNKLKKITKMNKKDIYKIFENVAKNDYDFAEQFYNYRKIKHIPYERNIELKNMVNSIARMTANEYVNISNTKSICLGMINENKELVFKGLKEAYREVIDEAILNVSTGRETINDVLKRSLKEFDKGLRVVYDKTYIGKDKKEHHYTKRLDSALRQQMNDGLRRLHNEMQQEIGKQFRSDGVEITVHAYPAIDHEDVQGRQFSNDEFEKLQSSGIATDYTGKEINIHSIHKDGSYTLSHRPISKYNCYHYTFAIILGVNEPQYTDEQLQKLIDDNNEGFIYKGKHYTMYQGTQIQRQLETAIRDNKNYQIMAKASGDEQMIADAQHNITVLNKRYKDLCNVSGLPSKANRMSVSGYKRTKVNRVTNGKENRLVDLKYGTSVHENKTNYVDLTQQLKDLGKNKNLNKETTERRLDYSYDMYKNKYENIYFEPDKKMKDEIKYRNKIEAFTDYKVYLNPKTKTQNTRNPDFWIEDIDELWDLKKIDGNGKDTIDTLFKKAIGQTENLILRKNETKFTTDEIIGKIRNIYENNYRTKIKKVVLLDENDDVILYYKR